MKIFSREQIQKALFVPQALKALEEGFILHSQGETVIPPVASLHFTSPPGECHIKYGYAKSGKYYVVKIASGFYANPQYGLPSTNGLILLFDQQTGNPVSILLDDGYLTDLRTALTGCIAAKLMAPREISCIGIVGTGAQAFYQLKFLSYATHCRNVIVWGRDAKKTQTFAKHADLKEWKIASTEDLNELTEKCNLIVTTTASSHPLLFAHQIKPGTHITAVGADDIGKQELHEGLFLKADKIIVDSKTQSTVFGDSFYALKKGIINLDHLVELGEILINPDLGRTSDTQITLCDLTGIAIQDLQIAECLYKALSASATE